MHEFEMYILPLDMCRRLRASSKDGYSGLFGFSRRGSYIITCAYTWVLVSDVISYGTHRKIE